MTTTTYKLSDKTVDRVGYGAMQLPGPGVMGPPRDHDEAVALLRRAVELGVNHIDTAQFYGPNVANDLIREALHPYSDQLAFVSKVGAKRDAAGAWLPAQRPEELTASIEENLRSLATEQLAAINLRLMDQEHEVPADQVVPLDDQLAAMVAARDAGKIAGIGLSNAILEQVQHAHTAVGLVCVQNPFSYVDQTGADVLDFCQINGIAFVPFFPLGSAFPGLPKVVENADIQHAASELGVSPAQVGLAWLLQRADNVLLIPGTSTIAHLEENLAVRDIDLSTVKLPG